MYKFTATYGFWQLLHMHFNVHITSNRENTQHAALVSKVIYITLLAALFGNYCNNIFMKRPVQIRPISFAVNARIPAGHKG